MADKRKKAIDVDDDELETKISDLIPLIKKQKAELKEKEDSLNKAIENFEKEKSMVCGTAKSSDILYLDVGGKKMKVLRRTLTCFPGSMLASRFSGRWDDSIEKDNEGYYFIDQDFDLFEKLVSYLRARSNENPNRVTTISPYFEKNKLMENSFRVMVEYYGMTLYVYPPTLHNAIKYDDNQYDDGSECLSIKTAEWTSFYCGVKNIRHDRKIKSFEVTVGEVDRIQIGWKQIEIATSWEYEEWPRFAYKGKGIGDVVGTIGLDLTRCGLLIDGNFRKIESLVNKVKKGCVIRCEDYGQCWLVDGQTVACVGSSEKEQSYVVLNIVEDESERRFCFMRNSGFKYDAAISCKGECHISDVVYE